MKISVPWRSVLPLVCGLCAALIAVWLVDRHISDQLQQQQAPLPSIVSAAVVVPAMDLVPGTLLEPEHLQVRELPVHGLPADVVAAHRAADVFDAELGVAVTRGRPLQYLHLKKAQAARLSELLKPGQRAFALLLGSGTSSGRLVAVGDHVDLYEQRDLTFVPLLQAEVIAVGDSWQAKDYDDGASSLTLAVPAAQVARLESLNRQNALAFWLRNREDNSPLSVTKDGSVELIIAGQTGMEAW